MQINSKEAYNERKQQLINNFVNHNFWVFSNEIKQSYPYDLSQADISEYKEALRAQLNIPAFPITDEEFDEIINRINRRLRVFVEELIKEDEKQRSALNTLSSEELSSKKR